MARRFLTCLCWSITWSVAALSVNAADPQRLGVYAIDIEVGKARRLASEPLPGHAYCGSPDWSFDGKRVVFDATPGKQWNKTHILATDYPDTKKREFADLGPGNCPTWSPDAKRIAFLLNPCAVADAQAGIWIMRADGMERKRLSEGDLPKWCPDGKQILSVTFSNPCQLKLIDVARGESQPVTLADHEFFSVPSWGGDGETLVAVVRSKGKASIALVDVSDPAKATIKRKLWTRSAALNDELSYPVYSAKSNRCAFVGRSPAGFALYVVDGKSGSVPTRLEPNVKDTKIASLALSSDGRKVLFCSEREQGKSPGERSAGAN